MSNQIQIFNSPEFGKIQVQQNEQGEPLFLANEVATALGYSNQRDAIRRHVDVEDVVKHDTLTKGGIQSISYITESGMYSLVLSSKLESAKRFKRWITSEVLPSIRKTGGYLAGGAEMSDEEIMTKALRVAEATIARKAEELKALQRDNEKLKEASDYVASILTAKETLTVTQIAQDYGTTANRLNVWLSDMGIQRKVNGQWVLRAPYLGQGYVKSEQITYRHSDGRIGTKLNTRWTNAGRLFLYKDLKEQGILPLIEQTA